MRRVILAALLGVVVSAVPQAAWGITYGEADNGEHPNVGSFVVAYPDPDTGETVRLQLCTGTLVESDVVVSAAHCFLGILPGDEVYFTLDEVIDSDRDGFVDADITKLSGTSVVDPLAYSGGYNDPHDIAVFLLDSPVEDVKPAALPEADALKASQVKGSTFTTVGYGVVRETNRKGWQSFTDGWRREKVDQHLNSVTKAWATFSMNLATGNGGTCFGDSGGPHFLGDVVVSITVGGDSPCKATDKTYRLDTGSARQFLGQFVRLP